MDRDFSNDVAFLEKHVDVIMLSSDESLAMVAVVPQYQGRVMTSTASGEESFGWLNYEAIASNEIQPHINVYGGEERFWMGPEGGQFAIFFKEGDQFGIEHWQTPGHARHHLAYVIGDTCFTGDVAGVRLAASPYVSITSAPPQFDHAAYLESIDRLMAARFDTLHLTHFGLISDVEAHLDSYQRRVIEVYQRVGAWCREGADESYIRKRHRALEHDLAMKCGLSTDLWAK